ncbi:MAG: multicopper oxidase family protein, partial [Solirubrobacterales bacterium]|nr:multicopper oxidase family protein [Solirubrobacterales bacterium]
AYWYHSHLHGQSNQQVFGGMAGPMIIRGGLDVQKGYRDIGTRVLVINQTTLGDGVTVRPEPQGPFIPLGAKIFVNGQLNPQIDIAPGELQRWRIFNISAGVFVKLRLQGQPFRVLANDGNNLVRRTKESPLLISPSSRREVLVQGGPAGSYELIAQPFAQFGPTSALPPATLATLNSSGKRVDDPMPPGRLNFRQPDLRGRKINSWHSIKYTQGPPNFFINGQQFSGEQNVAQRMKLGRVAKWKITNSTPFWHTFHIHINDFQIIQQNGHPVNNKNFDDNVAVSPNGGSVTMLYKPREFTGRFVFHCHILGHEDNGMMAVVQVQKGDVPPRQ